MIGASQATAYHDGLVAWETGRHCHCDLQEGRQRINGSMDDQKGTKYHQISMNIWDFDGTGQQAYLTWHRFFFEKTKIS